MRKLIIELTEAERAYIAGFLDGDGCITYQIGTNSVSFRITFVQRDPSILLWLQSLLGGCLTNRDAYGWGGRRWSLTITGRNSVLTILEQLSPYLRVKASQTRIALDYYSAHVPRKHVDPRENEEVKKRFRVLRLGGGRS